MLSSVCFPKDYSYLGFLHLYLNYDFRSYLKISLGFNCYLSIPLGLICYLRIPLGFICYSSIPLGFICYLNIHLGFICYLNIHLGFICYLSIPLHFIFYLRIPLGFVFAYGYLKDHEYEYEYEQENPKMNQQRIECNLTMSYDRVIASVSFAFEIELAFLVLISSGPERMCTSFLLVSFKTESLCFNGVVKLLIVRFLLNTSSFVRGDSILATAIASTFFRTTGINFCCFSSGSCAFGVGSLTF
ncbi:hypothetical protein HanPSC8_Chr05g0217301 [Helianthus annuus]|nr:hypothetical protein HanPSC8_Chr05g0217301 [Helianthus annuus]